MGTIFLVINPFILAPFIYVKFRDRLVHSLKMKATMICLNDALDFLEMNTKHISNA